MGRAGVFGLVAAGAILWLVFFAEGPGPVEVATLAVAVVAFVWFATVDPARLVGASRRPQPMLFFLAAVGLSLLVTAAALLASVVTFLILAVGVGGVAVGLVRAVRHGLAPEKPDGVP